MPTTRQMAKIAHVAEQTIRNYSRDYAELLSPAARGEAGPRLFSDEDAQVLCTIATLRREGIPQTEVITRLRAGDIVVDATPTPQQTTPSPQTALEAPQAIIVALTSMQRRVDALERTYETARRNAYITGAIQGAIAVLAAAAFLLWVLYLLTWM